MRWGLVLIFGLLCLGALALGARTLEWSDWADPSGEVWLTLTASRLPRLMALILTGVGLSVCGVILRHILRNRFAEPATTGGMDAAKLGILVAMGLLPASGPATKMMFALVFCFVACLVFVGLIQRLRLASPVLVPVIGLMYGAVLSAVAEFYAYRQNILQSVQGWLMGDFSKIVQGNYEIIYLIAPIVILTYVFAHRFTVVGMGEGVATSLGLNYRASVAVGLMLVAVTVSATVITVGAIPFVGLVIPNLVALFSGDQLSRTLPVVALCGAIFLMACDLVGRLVIYPFEVPIGLTAGAVGGAIFLGLILWRRGQLA